MATLVFVRPMVVIEIVDGDTIKGDIDLGKHAAHRHEWLDLGWHVRIGPDGHVWLRSLVRVDGINAPELGTPEGDAAKAYAQGLLPAGTRVALTSKGLLGSTEKYGRVLGDVEYDLQVQPPKIRSDFATAMLGAGMAKPWDGKGPRP